MTSLVVGTAALNLVFVAVGYALLAPALREARPTTWLSYAGVTLFVGFGATGVVLCIAAIVGLRVDVTLFGIVAVLLAVLGFGSAVLLPARLRASVQAGPEPGPAPAPALTDAVATALCALVIAVLGISLIGAFRSTPWLSDVWTFWLPKGIALDKNGLDPSLWLGKGHGTLFPVPDYPLLWSIVLNLDVRFVRGIDLRAVNVQEAYLLIGFAGAAARLLWGLVRPWLLWGGVLLTIALPEFLRHAQGGAADVPLSMCVTLALLASALWLMRSSGLALALVVVFSAAAFSIKTESYPDIAIWLVFLTAVAWTFVGRRVLGVWAAVGLGALTSVPWLAWKAVNGVPNQIHISDMLSVGYLAHHGAVRNEAVHVISHHFTSVREWTVVFPLFVVLAFVGFALERGGIRRRVLWLAAPAFVVSSWAFLVWIFWADRIGTFRLSFSAYRLVDATALISALGCAFCLELILRERRAS